jgi:Mg2+ and Co2+ transporter CorA
MEEKKYWNRWYIAVVAFLLLLILAFYFITKKFA